ncbi:MAG: tail fiber domain-containing protein [Bacteroidales bacterium]|nr:tail fiber domain-containing protein [Bacteroidales bacterium]
MTKSDLGLEFINKLNPVSYTRLNDEKQKTEYGFIAQELEETLQQPWNQKSWHDYKR